MKKNIGLLTAMAIGDSFGRSFKFISEEKIDPKLDLTKYHPAIGKYADGYQGGIGRYTDDTQMAIAIAEHMLNDKPFTTHDYSEALMQAYKRDKRTGYGKRIQNLLDNSRNASDFQHNIGIQKPRDSNGSVIRCLPLGLYQDVNMVKHACIVQTSLTHPTMDAIMASQIMALTVHYAYHGSKKTYTNWITDHIPFGIFNYIADKYTLGKEIECDAALTASYCLNVAYRQYKFKKLVPAPKKAKFKTPVYNGHYGVPYTAPEPVPDATMNDILKHAIIETGGDTDSIAAIGLALAAIRGAKNDLNINLFNNLENDKYGRDYLISLDKRLLEKFPRKTPKAEKVKEESSVPVHILGSKTCLCAFCTKEKEEKINDFHDITVNNPYDWSGMI